MTQEPTKSTLSRDFYVALIAAVAAVLVTYIVLGRRNTEAVCQLHNLRLAEERMPQLQALLDANPRYKDVSASPATGGVGSIRIAGSVETTDDLLKLMREVAGLQLPVAVWWEVHVVAADPAK